MRNWSFVTRSFSFFYQNYQHLRFKFLSSRTFSLRINRLKETLTVEGGGHFVNMHFLITSWCRPNGATKEYQKSKSSTNLSPCSATDFLKFWRRRRRSKFSSSRTRQEKRERERETSAFSQLDRGTWKTHGKQTAWNWSWSLLEKSSRKPAIKLCACFSVQSVPQLTIDGARQ